jgi:hypothetical protein
MLASFGGTKNKVSVIVQFCGVSACSLFTELFLPARAAEPVTEQDWLYIEALDSAVFAALLLLRIIWFVGGLVSLTDADIILLIAANAAILFSIAAAVLLACVAPADTLTITELRSTSACVTL